MIVKFVWSFWWLVLLTSQLCFFNCKFFSSDIIRKLFILVDRHRAHFVVVYEKLFTVLGYLNPCIKLKVIHQFLLQCVVVLSAMDWVLLQLLEKSIMMPSVILIVIDVLIVEPLVCLSVSLKCFSIEDTLLFHIAVLVIVDVSGGIETLLYLLNGLVMLFQSLLDCILILPDVVIHFVLSLDLLICSHLLVFFEAKLCVFTVRVGVTHVLLVSELV